MRKYMRTVIATTLAATLLVVPVSATTVLKGDSNQDGKITAADARTVLRYSASLEKYENGDLLICDVTNDGKITAADARAILRCAASLDPAFGSIDSEGTVQGKKTDLTNDFTLSAEEFINKQNREFKTSTMENGAVVYECSGAAIVSDPKMVAVGKISSIIIRSDTFSLNGVYPGMDKTSAVSVLTADGWIEKENNETSVVMSRVGMFMNITVNNGKITVVEYTLAKSLVNNKDPNTEPTTLPNTNPSTEPTTIPNTNPSAEPTTTPNTNPSTEPTTTPILPEGYVSYYDLPEQIQSFLGGSFGFSGSITGDNGERNVQFFSDGTNIKTCTALNGNDVIIMKLGKGENKSVYFCCENTNKCHKLTALDMMVIPSVSLDDFDLNIGVAEPSNIVMEKSEIEEDNVVYQVYAREVNGMRSEIYTINGEIKRVLVYGNDGILTNRIDMDSFFVEIPADAFSIEKYSDVSSLIEVLT